MVPLSTVKSVVTMSSSRMPRDLETSRGPPTCVRHLAKQRTTEGPRLYLSCFTIAGRRAEEQGDVRDHGRRAGGATPGHVARARQALRQTRLSLPPSGKKRSEERCYEVIFVFVFVLLSIDEMFCVV